MVSLVLPLGELGIFLVPVSIGLGRVPEVVGLEQVLLDESVVRKVSQDFSHGWVGGGGKAVVS